MNINEKLAALRQLMARDHVDTYIITKYDPHQSEYSDSYWNGVRYVSRFSGSAGTVVVTLDTAGLWTDGRYYIQAERELAGSEFVLHRAAEQNVKDFMSFSADITPDGGAIGFDGRTLFMEQTQELLRKIGGKDIALRTDKDMLGEIWQDRPDMSVKQVFVHDIKYSGKSRGDKVTELRAKMKEEGIHVYALSSLDDIAWLFNLRAQELANETFFAAYAVVTEAEVLLFVEDEKVREIRDVLEEDGVILRDYGEVESYLCTVDAKSTVAVNPVRTNYALYKALENKKVTERKPDITSELKALKNETEIACLEKVNIRDGAAMVRFMKWLKESLTTEQITEWDVGEKLTEIRSQGENYLSASFPTIAGYMANAAMMHYSADKDDCARISQGMLLVDSGAHYLDGTTDITRTFVLGEVSKEMKRDFTLVLKSHIALAKTVFLYGATGSNLDIMARMPMWVNGMDYKSGTGHGVGFCLNVHEGPHSISQRPNTVRMEPGMIVTNEPGVYRENKYGIRTENTMLVKDQRETEFGRFLEFSVISYCPIDLAGIDESMLTQEEKDWLNQYHKTVCNKLSPCLNEEERRWLADNTKEIR